MAKNTLNIFFVLFLQVCNAVVAREQLHCCTCRTWVHETVIILNCFSHYIKFQKVKEQVFQIDDFFKMSMRHSISVFNIDVHSENISNK